MLGLRNMDLEAKVLKSEKIDNFGIKLLEMKVWKIWICKKIGVRFEKYGFVKSWRSEKIDDLGIKK